VVAAWLALGSVAVAASDYGGAPAIRHYLPAEYGGSEQVFGIAQSSNGEMLFADVNDRTVMRFDGSRWRRFPLPGDPLVLASGPDPLSGVQRTWVGAAGDLGYLEDSRDPARSMRFVSLLQKVPSGPCLENDRYDDVVVTPSGILFGQSSALLRWNGATFRCWTPPDGEAFGWSHFAGNRTFVGTRSGQYELVGDELVLLPKWGPAAAEIDELPDGKLMVLRNGERAVELFDPETDSFEAIEGPLSELLQDAFVQKAVALPNGSLAVALGSSGLAIVGPRGEVERHLDERNGLPGGEAYRLFLDREETLWVTVDRGLATIDFLSPLEMFPPSISVSGYLTDIARRGQRLFMTTFDGVFWCDESGASGEGEPGFRLLEGDIARGADSWHFAELADGQLYVVTDSGVARIVDAEGPEAPRAVAVSERGPLWIEQTEDPDRVLAVGNQRLQILASDGPDWRSVFRVDLPNYASFALKESASRYWVIGDGKLTIADFADLDEPPRLTVFRSEVEWYGLEEIGGQWTAWGNDGVFVLRNPNASELAESWVKDPRFAGLDLERMLEHPWGYGIQDDQKGGAWISTAFGFERWIKPEDGEALVRQPQTGIWGQRLGSVAADPDRPGIVWFERDGVISRFDASLVKVETLVPVRPLIARTLPVKPLDRPPVGKPAQGTAGPPGGDVLDYSRGTVRFEFSAPRFRETERIEYRVLLAGYDDQWSAWSRETRKDYTRLQEGDYVFRVQAQVTGRMLGEGDYSLRVLPPWYRSGAFRLVLSALALLVAVAVAWWIRRSLQKHELREKREREVLEGLVAERTAQLRSANQALEKQAVTDSLTGLHNRRFLRESLSHDLAAVRRSLSEGELGDGLAFVLVDLNRFKEINDSLGHAAGDRVLEAVAVRLRRARRESDYLVRWGGDEFLVVSRSARRDEVPGLAQRVVEAISEEPISIARNGSGENGNREQVQVTASVGFCIFPLDLSCDLAQEPERTLELADHCLYLAKCARDGGWCGILSRSGGGPPLAQGASSSLHWGAPGVDMRASKSVEQAQQRSGSRNPRASNSSVVNHQGSGG
jgi:diguanylate cyclase (GGDEF)-like protein